MLIRYLEVEKAILGVLSNKNPLKPSELIDKVVPRFTSKASEADEFVFQTREAMWSLISDDKIILTSERNLILA